MVNLIKESLSRQILITTIFVVLIIQSAFGINSYLTKKSSEYALLDNNIRQLKIDTAITIRDPLFNFDIKMVKQLVDTRISGSKVLRGMMIYQSESGGGVFVGRLKNNEGKIIDIKKVPKENYYAIESQEISKENYKVGSISYFFTDDHVRESLTKALYEIFFRIVVLELILVAAIYIALDKLIIRPIRSITKQINADADGVSMAVHQKTIKYESGEIISRRADELGYLHAAMERLFRERTKELAKTNNELELEIVERKRIERELQKTRQQAVAANESKSEFLSMMSHEIRTPMNAIIGMTHLALKSELTTKQREYMGTVQSASHSLLSIINDILDFSKIEAGKLDIETVGFNLEDVLNNLSNMMSIKAEEKGIEIHFNISGDVPLLLEGDPLRLGQVLHNLTSNAVKFTESGEIMVKIERWTESNHDNQTILEFTVKDTGIGLSRDQINKLFQSFSQADRSTTRKYGGTGLGLTISKRLVGLMGGEIRVESEPDKGSSFIFTAKFGKAKKEERIQLLPPKQIQGMKILVVDDSATSLEILQSYLESFSFEVTLAHSGKEAIQLLENSPEDKPYKLVLMDYKMPEMDGIKTSNLIKKNSRISFMPTIMMVTAYGNEDVMKQAEDVGMDGFLIKPVNPSVLLETITGAFQQTTVKRASVDRQWPGENKALEKIRGAKVLLVEDNAINQQVANDLLEDAGLVVIIASNGRKAVEKVAENDFDLVIMDLEMPEMDGYTATQEIRNMKSESRNIPIIAMTAHAFTGIKEKCLKVGMNDYATKPINPVELFKTMTKWIKPGEREISDLRFQNEDLKKESPTEKSKTINLESEISTLPGLDVREGLFRMNGKERRYRDYLVSFASEYEGEDSRLEKIWREAGAENARKKAHALKGVAGNLALPGVHTAATTLEKALKKKKIDKNKIKVAINELSDALEEALKSIKEYVKSDESEEATKQQPKKTYSINVLLDDLVVSIREADATALDTADKLQSALKGAPLEKESSALKKHLMEYEFDKANLLVETIKKKIGAKEK